MARVGWDVGRLRNLLPPGTEIPLFQKLLELRAALQTELFQDIVQVELDGRRRDAHPYRGLAVGVPQADQRGDFLLTWCEGLPLLPELVQGVVFGEAGGHEFLDKLIFWTTF